MTAINAFQHGDAIYVSADTAWCDKAGTLVSTASQLAVLSNQRALVWASARGETVSAIAQDVRFEFSSFDDLVEGLPSYLPGIAADHALPIKRDGYFYKDGFGLIVFGWSDKRNRAEVYECYANDLRPHNVAEKKIILLMPEKGTPAYELIQADMESQSDPELQATGILTAQRNVLWGKKDKGAELAFRVGGQFELATISDFGVRKEVIATFDDRIGSKIQPE